MCFPFSIPSIPMPQHILLVPFGLCLQELLKEQESSYEVSIFIFVNSFLQILKFIPVIPGRSTELTWSATIRHYSQTTCWISSHIAFLQLPLWLFLLHPSCLSSDSTVVRFWGFCYTIILSRFFLYYCIFS